MAILREHIEILNKENARAILEYHLQKLHESCKKNIASLSQTQYILQQKIKKDKDMQKDTFENKPEQENIQKLDFQLKEQTQMMQHAEKGLAVLLRIKTAPEAFQKEEHEFFVKFETKLQNEARKKDQISLIGVYILNLLNCHNGRKIEIAKFYSYLKINSDLLSQKLLAEGIPLYNYNVPQNRIAIKNRFGSPEQVEEFEDVKEKEEYLKLKEKLDQCKAVLENYKNLMFIIINLYYFSEQLSNEHLKFIQNFVKESRTTAAPYHRDPNFASVVMRFLKGIDVFSINPINLDNANQLQAPQNNPEKVGGLRQ